MEPDGALAFMGHSVRQKKVTRSLIGNIELGNSRSWLIPVCGTQYAVRSTQHKNWLLIADTDYFINGGLAQLARAPALHAGGHRFDSDILHIAMINKQWSINNKIVD